jgi:hypothetical protein
MVSIARQPPPRVLTFTGDHATDIGAVERAPRHIAYVGNILAAGAKPLLANALLTGNGTVRSRLHWTTWNRSVGRATGSDWHNNCIPDCAHGAFSAYPVEARISPLRWVDGYLVFTRLTVTYTGARPPGSAYRRGWVTYRLHYNAPKFAFYWR